MNAIGRNACASACAALLLFASSLNFESRAQEQERYIPSASDFGGVGLLQTRTARMGPDGQLDVGLSSVEPYNRIYINLHVLPWFEATFRYTEITNLLFSEFPTFSGAQSLKDRGADVKVQILKERKYVPALAIGLQDGLGTGLFSGEYVVISKRYYDFDFSLGMGWGYNGLRGSFDNPLIRISEAFRARGGETSPQGGTPTLTSYFSGERVALFGGVEYFTPIKELTIKLEYDGNNYESEPQGAIEDEATSPYNVGFNYRPFPWIDASLAWERGNTFMGRVSLRSNLHKVEIPKLLDDPPVPLEPRPSSGGNGLPSSDAFEAATAPSDKQYQNGNTAQFVRGGGSAIRTDAEAAGIATPQLGSFHLFDRLAAEGLEVDSIMFLPPAEAKIYVSGDLPLAESHITERVSQIMLYSVTPLVERVTLVQTRDGIETETITLEQHDVNPPSPADYMLDRLAADGFEVLGLEFSHVEAKIYVSRPSNSGPGIAGIRVADTVFKTAPTPVERVTLIQLDAGKETSRFTVRRGQMIGDAAVDMFDELAVKGLSIYSVELFRHRMIIRVSAHSINRDPTYRTAAQYLAAVALDPIEEVTLVAIQDGVEENRLTIHRIQASDGGAKSTESKDTNGDAPQDRIESSEDIAARLFKELEDHDFGVDAVYLERTRAEIFVSPGVFREVARNAGRAARIVANNVPAEVEAITIVQLVGGLESSRITIMRKDLERAIAYTGSPEEIWVNAVIEEPKTYLPEGAVRNPGRYPSFSWGLSPRLRSHIGGPDQFYLHQFWVALSAKVGLLPGLSVRTTVGRDIYNNFDRITLKSDSVLQRVRSDIKEYLQQGENNIVRLQADYAFSPIPEWYARVSAGLLEEMFGGYGGEVLYRPFASRWAFGVDYFYARQRTFEQRFEFQDYGVNTGHVNVYYDMPWYNLLTSLHVGHYLARDKGGTMFLSRLFDSGVRVGGWVTLTNVSAEDFGEGSFDKGFFVSIPLELFLLKSSRSTGTFAFRPLFRDGGQILASSKRLYDLTGEGTLQNIAKDWDEFLN